MSVLYIKEQGASIRKMGERVQVVKNNETLLDIPVFQVENIAVIGNVQLTTQAAHMLMQNGIDVSWFTYSGKYLGHTGAESSRNIFLRFEQYRCYLDMEKRLRIARIIIDNKIGNQIAVLSGYRWESGQTDWKEAVKRMEELRKLLPEKTTPNEILGIEGMCSNIYFGLFGQMLKCEFDFHGRNRRPPRDPVNVIISLAYTFLTKEMCSALDAESFETYLGFLHGIRYGRKSLALDLIEEFRQPAVDRLVLILFNKHMISRYDFEFPEDGSVVLGEEGFRKFCKEYERWMTGANSLAGDRSYRVRIREQVARLKRAIQNEGEYVPYSMRAEAAECTSSATTSPMTENEPK